MDTNVFTKIIELVEPKVFKLESKEAITKFFHLSDYLLVHRRLLLFQGIGHFTCFLLVV